MLQSMGHKKLDTSSYCTALMEDTYWNVLQINSYWRVNEARLGRT